MSEITIHLRREPQHPRFRGMPQGRRYEHNGVEFERDTVEGFAALSRYTPSPPPDAPDGQEP